ncbi:MAG: arsenate reductase [Acetobacteraceae bacterium]|nr:arsenate reductase [Acetobacteraceae bacterium]
MRLTIHGIRNCDTIKKARGWLDMNGIAHDFHDYKISGIEADMLQSWVGRAGWEAVLNRHGTSFRKLPDARKQDLDETRAIALMLAEPSMIRRPILTQGNLLVIGFDPARYTKALLG